MSSPTQRSLALMRSRGFTSEITEHWNHFSKRRNDLMGFCDILCMGEVQAPLEPRKYGGPITGGGSFMRTHYVAIAVQTTSGSNVSARVKKIAAEPRAMLWLQCGNLIEVHGWRKLGAAGARKKWEPVIKKISLDDLTKTHQGLNSDPSDQTVCIKQTQHIQTSV